MASVLAPRPPILGLWVEVRGGTGGALGTPCQPGRAGEARSPPAGGGAPRAERTLLGALFLISGELGRSRGHGSLAHYCSFVEGLYRSRGECKVLVFHLKKTFRDTLLPATIELDLTKRAPRQFWGAGGGRTTAGFPLAALSSQDKGAVTCHFEAEISAPFLVCCYFAFNDKFYQLISRN